MTSGDWNPYEAPQASKPVSSSPMPGSPAAQAVAMPATALMLVSAFSAICLTLALIFDVYLLVGGRAVQVQPVEVLLVRMIWGGLMLITNIVIFSGAWGMKKLRNHGLAKFAATLALIPCIGPCFILGIPFGLIALQRLGQPDVRSAFQP